MNEDPDVVVRATGTMEHDALVKALHLAAGRLEEYRGDKKDDSYLQAYQRFLAWQWLRRNGYDAQNAHEAVEVLYVPDRFEDPRELRQQAAIIADEIKPD
jgi:hypothetical protein